MLIYLTRQLKTQTILYFGFNIYENFFLLQNVQTGSGDHPASYSKGPGSFPRTKWPVCEVYHPSSSAGIKERVELYIYSPFWVFMHCSMVKFVPFGFVATVSANKNKFEVLLVYLLMKEKDYLSCTVQWRCMEE